MEAVRAVFCYDSDAPLVQDLFAQQKRLRMTVRTDTTDLELELRQPAHLETSVLLHRLALLGVHWGRRQTVRGRTGTFHELWRLAWELEFAVDLIAASRWGGTLQSAIREYFPSGVVQMMQKDALERLGLREMLCGPEMLAAVEPDAHLLATLLSLNRVMPNKIKATARKVVTQVVEELVRKLAAPMRQAVSSSLNRAARNLRPRHQDIDWLRTIRANLRHYQPEYRTIIPETRIGFRRRGRSLRDIVLCVDQSGSMASSVVYAGVFAAVLASIKAVSTLVVVFDTAVADLTPLLSDPVEVRFGSVRFGSAPSWAAAPTSIARWPIARDW